VNVVTRGFTGRRRDDPKLPPGQYLEHGFPVLQAGPTPPVNTATWKFTITTETGETTRWDWKQFTALPAEDITTDIHCVTQWSKLGTTWRGISLDALLHGMDQLHGWGQNSRDDDRLLFVEGFDPATGTYRYLVNQHFGASSLSQSPFRSPFRLQLKARYTLGS